MNDHRRLSRIDGTEPGLSTCFALLVFPVLFVPLVCVLSLDVSDLPTFRPEDTKRPYGCMKPASTRKLMA